MGAGEAIITREAGCVAIVGEPPGAPLRGRDRRRSSRSPRSAPATPSSPATSPRAGAGARRASASPTASPAAPSRPSTSAPARSTRARSSACSAGSRSASSTSRPAWPEARGSRGAMIEKALNPGPTSRKLLVFSPAAAGFSRPRPGIAWLLCKGGAADGDGDRSRKEGTARLTGSTTSRSCPRGAPATPTTSTSPGRWAPTASSCRCSPPRWTAWSAPRPPGSSAASADSRCSTSRGSGRATRTPTSSSTGSPPRRPTRRRS